MRLFSSKKICIMIASAGLLFAGVLIGTSVFRQHGARRTFEEEGYILTMAEDEDQVIVNQENRFASGSVWSRAGISSVAFRDEEGDRVVVDSDSFIHYDSNSLAAVKDGAISDMDQYLDGVIGCCYLPAGNTLVWDGSGFTAQSSDGEKRFENFIWKNSEQRYLLGSSSFTIRFSGGKQEVSDSGFLELYYLGNDKKIMQLTSGDNAWQVVTKDSTITFANGVVLNCEDGKISRSMQEAADSTDSSATDNTAQQTMNLQSIEIDATGSIMLGSTQYSSVQPTFRFTLFDGQDGASGENGAEGAPGEAGEDGEDGELGTEGAAGQEGQAGATGSTGTAGGDYTTVINGGVDTGVEIRTGIPAVIAPDDKWKITESSRSFQLVYEQEAYETVEVVPDKAYVYLYNVKTGEILQEWKDRVNIGSENSPGDLFELNKDVILDMDTTYGVAAIDTYTLGGTTYTTKLFEKIFTTDSSGVQVQLQDRTSGSFFLGVTSIDSYTSIESVSVKFYDQNGALADDTSTKLPPEEYTDATSFGRFEIGKVSGLKSNTWYRMKVSVNCKVKRNGTATTIEKELDWTTLKQEPVLGGLELKPENGYLVAKVRGTWDGSAYADPEDKDHALEEITYRLYDANGLLAANGIAKKEETSASTADVYFKVDGSLITNQSVYYVVADYTWNDGARSITSPVKESGPSKKSYSNSGITTAALNGRAFAESQALVNKGVSISFSGNGTELYNLTSGDASEGTTYESIRGSLLVNLNGIRLSVNDTRAMQLEVTDNKTYDKKLKFTSCDGKQGDIEGSFALPLDVDGLLANNTYAFTLSAYTYDQSSDSYKYQAIGTLTIRTDAEADITMGMRQAVNGGTGVDFWLGTREYTDAVNLKNYYNQKHGYVLDDGNNGESDYFANTNASYRNLSSIVFELYKGSSQDPDPSDLLGTCTVYGTDSNGDRATFMPGYSILYQKYYGSAVENCKDNNVGVGESFAHQFEYNYDTQHRYGKITEDELSSLSDGKFTIKVRVCYDYTYDRYNYSGNDDLYDYFIESSYLNMEDYVNELTVNNGTGLILADMVYQERPVAPSSVVDKNGYAVTVDSLLNANEGKYNGDANQNEKYDPALLDDTVVGVDVGTHYSDSSKLARTVTFYGTTYDLFDKNWPVAKSLTEVRDDKDLFGFKFTLPMTKSGSYDDLDGEDGRRADIPHLKLYMYNEKDADLTSYLRNNSNGFDGPAEGDRGYSFRKYDAASDTWLVYTSSEFLRRGQTYVFTYDAELDFTINNNEGKFSYPGDYYENEWVSGKKYAKNTALISQYTPLRKQEPQVDMELLTSKASDDSANSGSEETWQIYLDDPDDAVRADSLLGYNKDYEYVGCIYDAYGNPLLDQQSKYYANSIQIAFKDGSTEHSVQYVMVMDTLNKERIVATLDNAQIDPTTGATDAQKQTMEKMAKAMKQVTVDSAGNVTAGTQITVKRLDPNGVFYSWQAVYRLLDDYQSKNEQGRIPLTEHFYAGHETWTASSPTKESFQLKTTNQTSETDGDYTVTTTVDKETDDIISVDIARPEVTSNYFADMRRIAAVQITAAKKGTDDTNWEQIMTKQKDGTTTAEPYVLWQSVQELSGSNYGFTFRISSFNQSTQGGDSLLNAGDQLQFTYTFYYENGDRSTPQEIAADTNDNWYALKSMNGKQNGTALYERASRKDDVDTVQLNQQNNARSSVYKISSADGTDVVKPQIIRTAVQGNDGVWYVTDITQKYTLTQNPVTPSDLPDKGTLTRTESLRYGVDDETGYRGVNVTEFCKLGSLEATAEVPIGSIAPTLSSHNIISGITQAEMEMDIESYNLMDYPEDETLHLYYALYKVTEEESITGEKPTENLELTGVMIGEEPQTDADGKLLGNRRILMDQLEKNQKYRLYVYYKDNRDSENRAKPDAEIFGSALNGVQAGQFITDKAKAKALATCFTTVDGNNLVPSDNKVKNNIRKIMGYREVVVEPAGTDGSGNPIPAVLDYYDEFTTLEGIVIKKITANLGQFNSYLIGSNNADPTGKEGESSGKTLSVTATTSAKQNDYTRMFFVLERCPLNVRWTDENNWKTVAADLGTTGIGASDENYAPEYPTDKNINPEARDWDGEVTKLTKNNFRSYGTSYTYSPLTRSGGEYIASMKLTYYPGQVIVPGYYYRVRAMIFQYEKGWTNPTLVSLADVKSDKQYMTSGIWTWQKYEYNASDLPVKVTNVERDQKSIRATVRATDTGFYLDNYYYARLWKYENNQWVIQEDDKYYGTNSSSGGSKWNHEKLRVGKTYTLEFTDLTPNTQYQIRFYGLMDSNYDNHLNIVGSAGPLTDEDRNTLIYANTDKYQAGTDTTLKNKLSALYKTYLGIDSSAKAADLKIAEHKETAAKVLLNTSSSITTFDTNQTATIGSMYDYSVSASDHQIRLFFESASGLGNAKTISYTISYLGSATGVGTVSGQITAPNGANSPMDDGRTSGDVALTIKDDRLSLSNSGTYYIQLRVLDKNGTTIEEPATIDIDVVD